jgi:hypothetical protein
MSFRNLAEMIAHYTTKRIEMTPAGHKGDEMRHVATLVEGYKWRIKGSSSRYE